MNLMERLRSGLSHYVEQGNRGQGRFDEERRHKKDMGQARRIRGCERGREVRRGLEIGQAIQIIRDTKACVQGCFLACRPRYHKA